MNFETFAFFDCENSCPWTYFAHISLKNHSNLGYFLDIFQFLEKASQSLSFFLSFWLEFCAWVLVFSVTDVKKKPEISPTTQSKIEFFSLPCRPTEPPGRPSKPPPRPGPPPPRPGPPPAKPPPPTPSQNNTPTHQVKWILSSVHWSLKSAQTGGQGQKSEMGVGFPFLIGRGVNFFNKGVIPPSSQNTIRLRY